MVLLFWALSLFNVAQAHSFNYDENNRPTVVEGPVIQVLKEHYCTGGGNKLYLPRDVIRTEAFAADQARVDAAYREGGWIWVDSLFPTWDDKTIFADVPRDYDLLRTRGKYRGFMRANLAVLLNVRCPGGAAPIPYILEETVVEVVR